MKKSFRNFVIAAISTASLFGVSAAAFAETQLVQTDMNFRSGASQTASMIGTIPAGARVDYQYSQNGWDRVTFNGMTGYIHGGNLGDIYVQKAQQTMNDYTATQNYYDNTWTNTAANMNTNNYGDWKTVSVSSGYLALRSDASYDDTNEIGQLKSGDTVEIEGTGSAGSYVFVYSPKYDRCGWVNAGFLI